MKGLVLISWIGHADLCAMAADLGPDGERLLKTAKVPEKKYGEKPGPVKTAVEQGNFDEVHLLSNYVSAVNPAFAKWVGGSPE